MKSGYAIFCVRASSLIGGGHVMRCLVLAERLSECGWQCDFVCTPTTSVTVPALLQSGFSVFEHDQSQYEQTAALICTAPDGCDLLIIDDYKIDRNFEKRCRPWAKRIMVIDDLADRPHDCDVLMDQTLGRNKDDYSSLVPAHAQLLLGADFALLRPEFSQYRNVAVKHRIENSKSVHVLVSIGMMDNTNATAKVLAGIEESNVGAEVSVVLASSAPHLDDVKARLKSMSRVTHLHVDHAMVWDLMAHSDLAIGAAGSTTWERCCLGLPCLMIVTADNQVEVARAMESSGAAKVLGRIDDLSTALMADCIRETCSDVAGLLDMSKKAMMICDGKGVSRVLNAIAPLYLKDGRFVTSRPIKYEDTALLFLWQTAPGARAYSRNPNPPLWDEHVQWINHRLDQGEGIFELLEVDGEPVGFVRLDHVQNSQNEYEVSILVAQNHQGLGVGGAGLKILRRFIPDSVFLAHVQVDNVASRKIFLRSGYHLVDEELFRSDPEASL